MEKVRLVLPHSEEGLSLLGSEADRTARNRLQSRWLASCCADWVEEKVEVRRASRAVPQGAVVLRNGDGSPQQAVFGSFSFSTEGLGLAPGNPFNLIQASETPAESELLSQWFDRQWSSLAEGETNKACVVELLRSLAAHRDPLSIYAMILHHIFLTKGEELDEEKVVKSATGIRNTVVWKKLFKFQRDGVVGAIDKLNRYGGCIIADSVGLGKTFEALAIIKYHELRNDRVMVLCPKRLRDNWTLYRANDRRNFLASDRFNYDILNHTDLSRDRGLSGDIDLGYMNWGNYNLVVIDESHNFRNKRTPRQGGETRYDLLMRRIIREGVKTRVLMLSATPVNNRLADLRNQIAFATDGDDTALVDQGISSIDGTTRLEQKQFNRWLDLDDAERTPSRLIEMLVFDYFTLLDRITIARSRRHLEKYYGTSETGRFPERLRPINVKSDVDLAGEFPSIRDINLEIRRLNLAAYTPLRYVQPLKRDAYDEKYSTKLESGEGFFRQADREESLIQLLRVNALKRMESSVTSFALTVRRQLDDVEATLARIEEQANELEEIDIADVDIEDLLKKCTRALREAPAIPRTRIQWRKADIAIGQAGVEAIETAGSATVVLDEADIQLPDALTELQDRTQLTRRSIQRILSESHRLKDFKRNPQRFIELAEQAINRCKRQALVDGIKYQRLGDEHYSAQELFEKEELTGYLKNMLAANKSVYEHVIYESGIEANFAGQLEKNMAVKVYAKLPGWFTVPTPLGSYNPDWAVLIESSEGERLYFVVETKGSPFLGDLRITESAKIECGKAHFNALRVGNSPALYQVVTSVNDLLATFDARMRCTHDA